MKYLLLLLTAFFFTTCSTDNHNTSSASQNLDRTPSAPAQFVKQTISPPLIQSYQPAQQRQVDAEQGGRLTFPSGTEIDIPASAFVYPTTGEKVKGQVTISFREFRTAAEIILSGIPMRDWDDQTQDWQNFSTAGMFEIRGMDETQQAVEIAPTHPLTVHFVSDVEGTYDYWYFDEEKGDWEIEGQNSGETFTPPTEQNTSTTAQPTRPLAPRKYDPAAIRMTFAGLNLVDFPELKDSEKVALQYAGKPGAEQDPQGNEWIFSADWYKAELTKANQAGVYKLYLENDDQEFTTQVHATLLPAAYKSALAEYRQKLVAYEAELEKLKQQREQVALLRRIMQVNRFGVYNYDVYGSWQEPVFASADFQSSGQDSSNSLEQVYLITDGGRMTVRYPKNDWRVFNFDRSRRNILLGITSDLKIVMLAPEDFTNQTADLAESTKQQQWNCILNEKAFKLDDPASLQSLIDRHFAS
jgi:hypothetical protein